MDREAREVTLCALYLHVIDLYVPDYSNWVPEKDAEVSGSIIIIS